MPLRGAIACLVWLGGLLLALLVGDAPSFLEWLWLAVFLCVSGGLTAFFVPRYWRRGPKPFFYLLMTLLALGAILYYQLRIPQPSHNDISHILSKNRSSQQVIVTGKILSPGRLNASKKIQFWLETELIQKTPDASFQKTEGKVYLTFPKQLGEKLDSCQQVRITGQLYQPRGTKTPRAWDFKKYLASQGAFAGLKGEKVEVIDNDFCPMVFLRSRIIAPIQNDSKNEEKETKQLLISMALGQNAVSLSPTLTDNFRRVGLSHILVASGYQLSLLLGTLLKLTQPFSATLRFSLGTGLLAVYLGLTGLQPSIIRAGLMWMGILLGDLWDRQVRPLGALLVSATLMLIFNPRWIGDLGFQLSFLATFGIMVMTPYFEQKLDFLPPKIVELIAVPIAASVWTLPMLLSQFSQFVTISIPLNILVTPLVEIISLGGMISAIAALIYPPLGNAITALFSYPTGWLIQIVELANSFPVYIAVGKIPLIFLILTYGLMILIWLNPFWQKHWLKVAETLIIILFLNLFYQSINNARITIFEQGNQPVLIIQNRQNIILIEDGKPETNQYLIQPFLTKNALYESQINCRISLKTPLSKNTLNSCFPLNIISENPPVVEFEFNKRYWWLFVSRSPGQLTNKLKEKIPPHVVVWSGTFPDYQWLENLPTRPPAHPTAIAISPGVSKRISRRLEKKGIELLVTGEDGAITWTPKGFETAINDTDFLP